MKLCKVLSFILFIVCVFVAFQIRTTHDSFRPPTLSFQSAGTSFFVDQNSSVSFSPLEMDYYRESCPVVEKVVRATVAGLYELKPEIAPAIIRLFFHDCFPQGCDASVLLERTDELETEQQAGPNLSLKHLEVIDIIKSILEEACPGVVSCADIIVLAARESVIQAGGPDYLLFTGRRDSLKSFQDKANELPTPFDTHSAALHSFASRGFTARETVALFGAHSVGTIDCQFIKIRFDNFNGTTEPDPTLNKEFLETLRSNCTRHPSSHELPRVKMDYQGPRKGFGTLYFKSLLHRRGILFVDQQLTTGEETRRWVRTYASNATLFQKDFSHAMTKLSNLGVLMAPMGEVRLNCRKLN